MEEFKNNQEQEILSLLNEFSVTSLRELQELHHDHDQQLLKSQDLDYKNKDQIVNRIREHVEKIINLPSLSDPERQTLSEILWLWYHHQSQIAFFKHDDKAQALEFISKALRYHQQIESPNHITGLLKLIYEGNFDETENYIQNMPKKLPELQADGSVKDVDNYEIETARFLVDLAKENNKEE